jgi:hypothetical protein
MRVLESFPFEVREAEHVWVPVPDGTRLPARLWRPVCAASADPQPVPAVLGAIPYRHRDLTAVRDSIHHPYLAGHGYACLRSTCAAAVTPTACCSTSTPSRSTATSRAPWPGSPSRTGAPG